MPDRVAAVPTFISPFRWGMITQLSNGYDLHELDLLDARICSIRRIPARRSGGARCGIRISGRRRRSRRPRRGPARVFLGFARFPGGADVRRSDGDGHRALGRHAIRRRACFRSATAAEIRRSADGARADRPGRPSPRRRVLPVGHACAMRVGATCRSPADCRAPSSAASSTAARRCRSSRRTRISGADASCRARRFASSARRLEASGIAPVVSHASYLINLATTSPGAARAVDRRDGGRDRSRRGARAARRRPASGCYTSGNERGRARADRERRCSSCFARGGAARRWCCSNTRRARARRSARRSSSWPRSSRRCAATRASASASTRAICSRRDTTSGRRTATRRRSRSSASSSASIG